MPLERRLHRKQAWDLTAALPFYPRPSNEFHILSSPALTSSPTQQPAGAVSRPFNVPRKAALHYNAYQAQRTICNYRRKVVHRISEV
ncbi:uncharacterized protein THITE_2109973, partial [Thermothielavioides terrestris NRRL 8126]